MPRNKTTPQRHGELDGRIFEKKLGFSPWWVILGGLIGFGFAAGWFQNGF